MHEDLVDEVAAGLGAPWCEPVTKGGAMSPVAGWVLDWFRVAVAVAVTKEGAISPAAETVAVRVPVAGWVLDWFRVAVAVAVTGAGAVTWQHLSYLGTNLVSGIFDVELKQTGRHLCPYHCQG